MGQQLTEKPMKLLFFFLRKSTKKPYKINLDKKYILFRWPRWRKTYCVVSDMADLCGGLFFCMRLGLRSFEQNRPAGLVSREFWPSDWCNERLTVQKGAQPAQTNAAWGMYALLQKCWFVPVGKPLLSRFSNRERQSGTKGGAILSRVWQPGQKRTFCPGW